jgi:hypothetical protein
VRGAPKPAFQVLDGGVLRVEGTGAAGFAVYELAEQIRPEPGTLSWRWRTGTPIDGADLRHRDADDSPVRLLVVFRDRRMLFYTWGNAEATGAWFASWTGDDRIVWVLRTAAEAARFSITARRSTATRCPSPRSGWSRIPSNSRR